MQEPLSINLERARELGLMQLTEFSPPTERIQTGQHGTLQYLGWLQKEAERIRSSPGRVAKIVGNNDGECALFVNRVAGNPSDDKIDEDEE